MSQEKLLSNLVLSLEEVDLYKISKVYIKEVEGLKNIIICNGPWDSGIDLTNSNFDVQIQATVEEKNFEKKLFTDVAKAQSNVDKYRLPNRIYYFYSRPISNSLKLKYKKRAKDENDIILNLIDANIISQSALEYSELSTLLLELSQLEKFQGESKYFDNVQVKAYYDLMSYGTTTDIKFNIIKSFILNYLFNNNLVSKDDLLSKTNQHFNSKIDKSYFDSVIARLSSEQKIKISHGDILLLDKEKERINNVLVNYRIEENLLLRDISEALKRNKISDSVDEVLEKLIGLYESNYALNLTEFTSKETNINDFKTALHHLTLLITKISNGQLSDKEIEDLVKLLVKIADSSEILPRIASGHVYSKVSDPDRLDRYISQHINNNTVFLDTNVIVYLLLVSYEPDADYNNYQYKVASQFYEFAKSNDLELKTINFYSMEVAAMFKEAISIIPFTRLPAFKSLGRSNNIFHRFYQHLSDYNLLGNGINTFESFLSEFRITSRINSDDNLRPQMEYLFETLNIEIEDLHGYDSTSAANLIRSEMRSSKKVKSDFAIKSDALMIERLADKNSELNPVDPIFCTWDFSLIKVRRNYFEDFPSCTRWHMFTPTRLMDHLSMMNFKIKPGVVSNEVWSILDDDFGLQQSTHSLLDSISAIIQTNNPVGLKYTNMLANMRDAQRHEAESKPELFSDSIDVAPIDIIFRKLFETYVVSKEGKAAEFKKLFTIDKYFEDITNMLVREQEYIYSNPGQVSSELFIGIDKILEEVRSDKANL